MTVSTPTGEGRYAAGAGAIHYRWWSAEVPRWAVLFAHGFGDHSGRWQRYAETLAAAGGAVFACDHRGHGRSDGPRALIDDFDAVARDYLGLCAVPALPRDVPVFLAGHSMGGLIAARAATLGLAPATGLVLSSTLLGPWPAASALLESLDRGEPIPAAARGHPLLDSCASLHPTALSRDPAVVDQFVGDELSFTGSIPVETLHSWVELQARFEDLPLGGVDLPTLYLHGGADPLLSHRQSVTTLARVVRDDLEVRVFPGARHSIYNETNRGEIFAVLTGFITRVTG